MGEKNFSDSGFFYRTASYISETFPTNYVVR